ncbi:unnamed protein product [Lampetra fluviatilis]
MTPLFMKQEPEDNPSLDTLKGIKVKYEEVKVKCEEVTVKSVEVKVKFEDDSTPKSDLHIDGGSVKQELNSDCEAERGNSQEFVDVEVWVDFLDNTKSNGDQRVTNLLKQFREVPPLICEQPLSGDSEVSASCSRNQTACGSLKVSSVSTDTFWSSSFAIAPITGQGEVGSAAQRCVPVRQVHGGTGGSLESASAFA